MDTKATTIPDPKADKPPRARHSIPVLICLFAAILTVLTGGSFALWTQVLAPARETARLKQVDNNLFSHSGWHPSAVASVAQDEKVAAVWCCPLCYTSAAPIVFYGPDGDFLDETGLRPETVDEARQGILNYQAEPRYHRLRVSFGRKDEAGAERQASAEWERYQSRIAQEQPKQPKQSASGPPEITEPRERPE